MPGKDSEAAVAPQGRQRLSKAARRKVLVIVPGLLHHHYQFPPELVTVRTPVTFLEQHDVVLGLAPFVQELLLNQIAQAF